MNSRGLEGAVLAPGAGRVLSVPVSEGRVVLPGETIATIAEDNYILRLLLPERHAQIMRAGDARADRRARLQDNGPEQRREGGVRLVYPEIQGGRVIADVEVAGLGDYFVGERTRVYVTTGKTAGNRHPGRRRLSARRRKLRAPEGRRRSRRAAGRADAGRPRDPVGPAKRRRGDHAMKLGLSGDLTRAFISSPLTPLLLLAALIVGAIALVALPREEEPQISVPMVDIVVRRQRLQGGRRGRARHPAARRHRQGHQRGRARLFADAGRPRHGDARFFVGTDEDNAVLRVHEKIRANIGGLPKGIPEPLIVGRGINDVAIVVLTLAPKPERADTGTTTALLSGRRGIAARTGQDRQRRRHLSSSAARPNQIRVEPDPERLSLYGVTLNQLVDKLTNANRSFQAGAFRDGGKSVPVLAGQTLQGVPDIGLLLLTSRDGRPVYVKDVADVASARPQTEHRAWTSPAPRTAGMQKLPGRQHRPRQAQGRQRGHRRRRSPAAARHSSRAASFRRTSPSP